MTCAIRPRTAPAEITLRSAASTGVASSAAAIAIKHVRRRVIFSLLGRVASTKMASAMVSQNSRVAGFAREHAEVDTDLPKRLLASGAGVGTENQPGVGCTMQPAGLTDLVLELARRPGGI